MASDNLVERAAAFATARHNAIDHRRRYSGAPYTDHLEEVASILIQHRRPEIEVAAAWLHDVVEDTPTTIEEVEAEFGKEVATVVAELTDTEEGNRATRKRLAAERLANASAHGQNVKCADITSNTPSIAANDPAFAKVYIREVETLLAGLGKADNALYELACKAVEDAKRLQS